MSEFLKLYFTRVKVIHFFILSRKHDRQNIQPIYIGQNAEMCCISR